MTNTNDCLNVVENEQSSGAQSIGEMKEECRARANIYQVLAGVFIEEPDSGFIEALRSPQTLAGLAEAGVRFDADFLDPPPQQLEDVLAYEYATLFASPGGCPPVESARLTGRYQQEPYYAVRETYRRAGFALQQGKFAVFEDQLGVELSFVAALLEQAESALDREDLVEFGRVEKEIKRFWALHLGRWVRGYASLLERATEHSFYRVMARLLREFAEMELKAMSVRVEDADEGKEIVPKSEISLLVNPDEPVCSACEHGGGDKGMTR